MGETTEKRKAEIEALFGKARQLQQARQPDQALAAYREILKLRPDIPEVHFQIARILMDNLQDDRALIHAARATELRPAEPALWQLWAQCAALTADDAREAEFLAAVKAAKLPTDLRLALTERFSGNGLKRRNPPPPVAQAMQRLIALMEARRHADAVQGARELLRRQPKFAPALNLLATALGEMGDATAAIEAFRKAAAMDPGDATILNNLGQALVDAGQPDEAIRAFRGAVAVAPNLVAALTRLAVALNRRGDYARARAYAEKAARLDRRHPAPVVALGNALTRLQLFEEAEVVLRRAVSLDSGRAEPHALLAQALSRLDRDEEALEHYDRALAIDPNLALAVSGKAGLLQTLGRFEEAEPIFRRAFALEPANGETYRTFTVSHRVTEGDPLLDEMIARFDDPATPEREKSNFGFGIVKALEDLKQYDRAFPYLRAANDLARAAHPYDIELRRREVAQLMASMAGTDWTAPVLAGASDHAPIFITGMPRSGTTLVEQIVASHSTVTGAGEANVAANIASRLVFTPEGARPMADLAEAEIVGLGRDYAATMAARFPGAERITDKSIQSYMFMGLLKRALPNARFVVVRRDPRDNLLSIYRNKFVDGTHLYSNSLSDLGIYYRTFHEMIEFWRAELPADSFYEIQYEDLVADPEAQTRALIAACGLEWQDACLNFHQNKRKVSTLSVFQVRQPISRASLKAWEHYRDDLGEMFEALGDLLPSD